jgi:hypothetical protein
MKKFLSILCVVLIVAGCAHLNPGADPLVVRTEQFETGAQATLDLVVEIDNSNRPFFRTNAPVYHQFCAWLREPQPVTLAGAQHNLPRGVAMIANLDNIKLAYKNSQSSSNELYTALSVASATVSEASTWLSVITNSPAGQITK